MNTIRNMFMLAPAMTFVALMAWIALWGRNLKLWQAMTVFIVGMVIAFALMIYGVYSGQINP